MRKQEWEYSKIDLNDRSRKTEDIDLLNDAGAAGWELITITPNRIGYLKRQVARAAGSSQVKVSQA